MNPAVNEILTQYDSLSEIISKLPKNTKNFADLKKLWESFGETLHLFLLGYIDEINELNTRLKLQKVDEEERVKQLETKLVEFEKAIPKVDFKYSEKVCQNVYAEAWGLLEENTKTFLITAYYLNRLIQSSGADFSVVVIEFGKAVESELHLKLFVPYFEYRTTPLPFEGGKFGQCMTQILEGKLMHIPLSIMFSTLKPPTRKMRDYYNDFQHYLRVKKWDCRVLNNPSYCHEGVNYAVEFRNDAAHKGVLSSEKAKECKHKTKTLLVTLLSAYPKNKTIAP